MLLTKVYVWAKKVQRNYAWFQWRLVQNLKENWHEKFCKFLLTSWKVDFILESKIAELNKNKQKFKTTRSTKCSVRTLFYLGHKWISQLAKPFRHVLQNHCS